MAQCSKPAIDANWVSMSRMRSLMSRWGKRRTRSGTRALMGPIICMIPETLLLRAEIMEMREMSSFGSEVYSCALQFAMVRAQAASAHVSKSALIV